MPTDTTPKAPGFIGWIGAILLLFAILYGVFGCFKPKHHNPVITHADTTDTPVKRKAAADTVTASGYWCPVPTALYDTSPLGSGWKQYTLTCEEGGRMARYQIRMTPEGAHGTVKLL
ncbi:hypothetical protein AEAC466_04540 [Asticcacaulis sp. AC466]|uniref:hypothetical protein n=1 Tax=Asticcacaulis sp. AC466 TaxID=1282362 RepID=UPI0003C3ADA4|nr:hypothetical protein [Asticcacaulis sp. AC466]ESQ85437.1 hypothetical protein AEAC466_04540 [Asticcacaulis sp. AC466]